MHPRRNIDRMHRRQQAGLCTRCANGVLATSRWLCEACKALRRAADKQLTAMRHKRGLSKRGRPLSAGWLAHLVVLLLPGVLCAHDADNRELPIVDHVLLTHLHNQYVIFWREYPDAQGQGHVGGWRNRDSSPLDIDQIGHRYRCRFFDRRDNVYREVWSFGLARTDGDHDPEFEDAEVWAWSKRIDLQPKDPTEWDYYEVWD